MFALPVYLQPIAEETGWTRAGISMAMTIGFIVMGVAGFGWGTLSDRIGARPVVLIASVLLVAGLVIASRATDLVVFQAAYGGLVGASGGAFFAPIMAATVGWFEKNRSLAVSLVSVGGGVAPMVITPFASLLISTYGWRMAMLYIAVGAFVVLIPAAMLIRRAPAEFDTPVAAVPQGDGSMAAASAPRQSMRSVFRTPQFIVLAGTFFLCCAAHSGPIFHTVSYAMICGASALAAASIYSVEGIAGLAGRLVFGILADRLGVRRVLVAGLGMAYGGVMPLYSVLARDYFGPKVLGTVLGAATMTSSIGMAFGPVGGGWLYDTFGSYHWLYVASAAVGLAAAAMALAFPPPKKADGDTPAALQPA
jgi:MFS family permease